MGQKTNPTGMRIGITSDWRSKWFGKKEYKENLKQDLSIRQEIMNKWKNAAIDDVIIERPSGVLKLIIKTARPGVLIGRGGSGITDIQEFVKRTILKDKKKEIKVDVQEIKNIEESARAMAQNIAEQIEKRLPFKRVMKAAVEQAEKNRNVKGARIELAGRLGGAEMSRREWVASGTIPLHTLRADIDFARVTAVTTYGTIGVKVWLYKGEIFDDSNKENNK